MFHADFTLATSRKQGLEQSHVDQGKLLYIVFKRLSLSPTDNKYQK